MADSITLGALLNPRVTDREGLDDFIENLTDKVPEIERDIARLKRSPHDRDLIADLFRALHNVKGDSALCKVEVGVLIAHPIETLLARLRNGEIAFTDLLAEITLLALDRLELAVEALAAGRSLGHLKLIELVGGLDGMATLPADAIDERAVEIIEAVTGFRPAQSAKPLQPKVAPRGREAASNDLKFFRTLSLQLEARAPQFKGRTARLLRLAFDTNAAAGSPVDATQLEAAVYLHDIGMMMLPETVWLKPGNLSDDDKKSLHAHPAFAAGLLERMSGWAEATTMVAQHHEMPDGGGYPAGAGDRDIVAGAKILAIVDAFEAVMQKHSDRGHSRSLLRAIAEINACDNQFAPEWIGHFNGVVRKMVE
ncbi:MAG: Hpt domain-containing protein [Gammaproteobacteria bacterium]|nr:Hpt domain-containing protein [Gammaproteobacteria bacterium]MBU1646964.1 Hpt domain-containing protein [Gammaproteobacteria bacterium]MBU1972476.1 Hpt domain-containing protein [Gammaproteobacteria bacterium]